MKFIFIECFLDPTGVKLYQTSSLSTCDMFVDEVPHEHVVIYGEVCHTIPKDAYFRRFKI